MGIKIIRRLLSAFCTSSVPRVKSDNQLSIRTVEDKANTLQSVPFTVSNKSSFSISLSENIHLFGNILGEVIQELEGNDVFSIVEELRAIAKSVRSDPSLNRSSEITNVVQKLDLKKATKVLRAFTIYFHLVNEAEKLEIVRVNKERELSATFDKPRKEAISEAIYYLRERGIKPEKIQTLLNRLHIQPVFTAHPTEVKRPELMTTLNAISNLVQEHGVSNHIEEIKKYIKQLWLIPEMRSVQPTAQEEAKNTLYFLSNNVFPLIPRLHNDLKDALDFYYGGNNFHIPDFIKIGSWVGGDRDGNPNVTPQVTEEVVKMYSSGVECLKKMYNDWSFFKTVIDNCQLSLAKADMHTAAQYISLVEPKELGERIFKDILEEYKLTSDMLLNVTSQLEILENIPVIRKSIRLRNPYTDPLNYIQVQLLKRYKEVSKDEADKVLTPLILTSVHGIAAGMQETG